MITVLAMGWNHQKVESLDKTLAKRFVKVRSLWVYVVCRNRPPFMQSVKPMY